MDYIYSRYKTSLFLYYLPSSTKHILYCTALLF